jgi:hypothetical protein
MGWVGIEMGWVELCQQTSYIRLKIAAFDRFNRIYGAHEPAAGALD